MMNHVDSSNTRQAEHRGDAAAKALREPRLQLVPASFARPHSDPIIGTSAALADVLRQVDLVAATDATVLLCGETGTGKELVARAIVERSRRPSAPFVRVNCAALPSNLLESELFGHERGAFTGAVNRRAGRFELAHRGTLLLDEIGEVDAAFQPKLLRVLQERELERVGGSHTLRVDVRIIASTHRDLAALVASGAFREDLYYRLNVFPIRIPSLRERREDIPALATFFAETIARRMGKSIRPLDAESHERLAAYDWPGNVRELQNVIERAVILSDGPALTLPAGELQPLARRASLHAVATPPRDPLTLAHVQREHVLATLEATRWVISGQNGAAARLGLPRSTLKFRMKQLGIVRPG